MDEFPQTWVPKSKRQFPDLIGEFPRFVIRQIPRRHGNESVLKPVYDDPTSDLEEKLNVVPDDSSTRAVILRINFNGTMDEVYEWVNTLTLVGHWQRIL